MKLQKFPILAAVFLGAWLGFPTGLWAFGGARASHGSGGGRSAFAARGTFLGRPYIPARPVFAGCSALVAQPGFAGRSAFAARAGIGDPRFSNFRRDRRDNNGLVIVGGFPNYYGYPYGGYPNADGAYPASSYDSGAAMGYPGYAPGSPVAEAAPPPPVGACANALTPGGDMVGNVQRALRCRGFYQGPIDGVSGQPTRAAIRAYAATVGLPASGIIDAQLMTSLGIM